MNQLDLFYKNSDDFLYREIQKVRNSMDRRSRAMFAIISEIQDQLLKMQEKKEENNEHVM